MSNLPGGVHETRYGEIEPRVHISKFCQWKRYTQQILKSFALEHFPLVEFYVRRFKCDYMKRVVVLLLPLDGMLIGQQLLQSPSQWNPIRFPSQSAGTSFSPVLIKRFES